MNARASPTVIGGLPVAALAQAGDADSAAQREPIGTSATIAVIWHITTRANVRSNIRGQDTSENPQEQAGYLLCRLRFKELEFRSRSSFLMISAVLNFLSSGARKAFALPTIIRLASAEIIKNDDLD